MNSQTRRCDPQLARRREAGAGRLDLGESIRENADALPVDERARAEMQRRLDLHRDEPDAANDLDVVLARLRSKD
jgi:hypothetical protein